MFDNNQIDELKDYPPGIHAEFFTIALDELLAKKNKKN